MYILSDSLLYHLHSPWVGLSRLCLQCLFVGGHLQGLCCHVCTCLGYLCLTCALVCHLQSCSLSLQHHRLLLCLLLLHLLLFAFEQAEYLVAEWEASYFECGLEVDEPLLQSRHQQLVQLRLIEFAVVSLGYQYVVVEFRCQLSVPFFGCIRVVLACYRYVIHIVVTLRNSLGYLVVSAFAKGGKTLYRVQ